MNPFKYIGMKLSGAWQGNGTPQGGDEMISHFGGFDKNPESSWRVDVVVEDGKINLKTMSLGQNLSID